jgi:nitrate reductase gamma subunit
MLLLGVVIKDGTGRRWFARSFTWSAASERLVNATFVVIRSELFQLSLQVDYVPD